MCTTYVHNEVYAETFLNIYYYNFRVINMHTHRTPATNTYFTQTAICMRLSFVCVVDFNGLNNAKHLIAEYFKALRVL